MRFVWRGGNDNAIEAICKCAGENLVAKLEHGVEAKRDDINRQPATEPSHERDRLCAMRFVVKQQHGSLPTRRAIRRGECRNARQEVLSTRKGIAHRPGRANRTAGSTARTNLCNDVDSITVRRNRSARTVVEAVSAPGPATATVRTDVANVVDIKRLLEFPHKVGYLEHRLGNVGGIVWIDLEIAVA